MSLGGQIEKSSWSPKVDLYPQKDQLYKMFPSQKVISPYMPVFVYAVCRHVLQKND